MSGDMSTMRAIQAERGHAWIQDSRGAIATEYAVVVGTCALVVSVALAALGPPMIASYQSSRATLIAPVP
jgi:Flp pilus assembly pilin Flp